MPREELIASKPYDADEQSAITAIFAEMLDACTQDGGNKRSAGTKVDWRIDESHMAAVWSHFRKHAKGELVDPDSGAHPFVHAAWRLLAIAYQEVEDERLRQEPPRIASASGVAATNDALNAEGDDSLTDEVIPYQLREDGTVQALTGRIEAWYNRRVEFPLRDTRVLGIPTPKVPAPEARLPITEIGDELGYRVNEAGDYIEHMEEDDE